MSKWVRPMEKNIIFHAIFATDWQRDSERPWLGCWEETRRTDKQFDSNCRAGRKSPRSRLSSAFGEKTGKLWDLWVLLSQLQPTGGTDCSKCGIARRHTVTACPYELLELSRLLEPLEPLERLELITSIHTSIIIHPFMHACRHTCRHADIHADMQTYSHTDNQTCRHTDIQTDKHTHTHIHTHTHTHIYIYIINCIHLQTVTPTHPHTHTHNHAHAHTHRYDYMNRYVHAHSIHALQIRSCTRNCKSMPIPSSSTYFLNIVCIDIDTTYPKSP